MPDVLRWVGRWEDRLASGMQMGPMLPEILTAKIEPGNKLEIGRRTKALVSRISNGLQKCRIREAKWITTISGERGKKKC